MIRRILWILALPLLARAQSLKEFEKKITEFTLPNGLHFIVCERHEAPVVSFHTYVNAGSVDDPKGQTGIAHMFEHMAFKGTQTIGTLNWTEEKKAIDQVEAIYDRLEAEENNGPRARPGEDQGHRSGIEDGDGPRQRVGPAKRLSVDHRRRTAAPA